jgi:hypothetical protein
MKNYYRLVAIRKDEEEIKETIARKKTERGALKLKKVLQDNNQIDEESYRLEIEEKPYTIEYSGSKAELFMDDKPIDVIDLEPLVKKYLKNDYE